MMELGFFLFFALVSILAAFSVILQKNPIYSALSLIVVIAGLGGLFLLLHATFVAVLQIVIYAGAIMTLFLFVIMMVDVQDVPTEWQNRSRMVLVILLLIAGASIWAISSTVVAFGPPAADFSVKALSRLLFTTYVFPFEAVSILIISSVIGALYIARKEDA